MHSPSVVPAKMTCPIPRTSATDIDSTEKAAIKAQKQDTHIFANRAFAKFDKKLNKETKMKNKPTFSNVDASVVNIVSNRCLIGHTAQRVFTIRLTRPLCN